MDRLGEIVMWLIFGPLIAGVVAGFVYAVWLIVSGFL